MGKVDVVRKMMRRMKMVAVHEIRWSAIGHGCGRVLLLLLMMETRVDHVHLSAV